MTAQFPGFIYWPLKPCSAADFFYNFQQATFNVLFDKKDEQVWVWHALLKHQTYTNYLTCEITWLITSGSRGAAAVCTHIHSDFCCYQNTPMPQADQCLCSPQQTGWACLYLLELLWCYCTVQKNGMKLERKGNIWKPWTLNCCVRYINSSANLSMHLIPIDFTKTQE